MIFKNFQLDKLNINNYNFFLLYGKNEGLQNEIIENIFKNNFQGEISKYDENDLIGNINVITEELLNNSLFADKKIVIINRGSDKLVNVIEELLKKKLSDVKIIIKSGVLEKKSKLRNLFEKKKELVTIPFYEDELGSLLKILNIFISKHEIKLSRESINLILDRANRSRENLKNELKKILDYSISNKNIDFHTIKKLTNLSENFQVNELADQYLCKNKKNISKILNENIYTNEDCILILRTILNKSKRLMGIIEKNEDLKDIDKTITNVKPPIFWKDKENVKKQAKSWTVKDLKEKIYQINDVETQIKLNSTNSLNIISDFITN
tara:strand:+ start:2455 stop:3429 length:975 start_codon:yes stop_codon:yes gene_type:complete